MGFILLQACTAENNVQNYPLFFLQQYINYTADWGTAVSWQAA